MGDCYRHIIYFSILTRAVDELLQTVPVQVLEGSLVIGATYLETLMHVGIKQVLPGVVCAILLAFGRAIGDAASLLYTAGYSSDIPMALSDPVATLPLAVFFQLSSPFPTVRERAYAAAVVLLVYCHFHQHCFPISYKSLFALCGQIT